MRVTDDIAEVLQATIRFANLRRIRSTRQVEELFKGLPIIGHRFKVLRPGEEATFRTDQQELRTWLLAIAKGKANAIAREVDERLGIITAAVGFDGRARKLTTRWAVEGVRDSYALGVALLLSWSFGLTKRLGYCDAPKCGRFRLDLTPRGRPWRYCNAAHRRKGDALKAKQRVADWRKAKKKSVVKSAVK